MVSSENGGVVMKERSDIDKAYDEFLRKRKVGTDEEIINQAFTELYESCYGTPEVVAEVDRMNSEHRERYERENQ